MTTAGHRRALLQMMHLPGSPWIVVSADFCSFDGSFYLLVVMDVFSRFPVIEPLQELFYKNWAYPKPVPDVTLKHVRSNAVMSILEGRPREGRIC